MDKIRAGIIGCGRISSVYRDFFENNRKNVSLVFAVDKEPDRAEAFAGTFGCGWSDDLADMLKEKPDVVHICTPHHLHKEQTIACLESGIHVLTEKPIAISLADADEMIGAAKRTGRKLGVIFQNRYIDGVIEAKRLISTGQLGEIIGAWSHMAWHRPPSYYQCDWKGSWETEGGGVLIDQAIHSIDLVRYLTGSDVEWIHGNIDNRILKTVEVEDVADAVIGFKNGCIYSLFACNYYKTNAPIQIEILGEKGKVNIKGFDVTIEIDGRESTVNSGENTAVGNSYWGAYHAMQISAFYDSLRNNVPVAIDGFEGRKTLELILGIYRSAREKRKIYL